MSAVSLKSSLHLFINNKADNISVFLDIPDWTDFPIALEKTISWINEQLIKFNIHSENYREKLQAHLDIEMKLSLCVNLFENSLDWHLAVLFCCLNLDALNFK